MATVLAEELSGFGEVEEISVSRFQRVVGRRLADSWSRVPHVTHFDNVDISQLDRHRRSLPTGSAPSPLIFLVRAVVMALKAHPNFNASLTADGEQLLLKRYYNIGIAVDGPLGLVVPVLRNADRKSVADLATELAALSAQAREKGLPMSAMTGGCMTISSLGSLGGTAFTPIINPPEVAILGVNPARITPVWEGDAFKPRLVMPLSLSYDHRVINGSDAARFLRHIDDSLARPGEL